MLVCHGCHRHVRVEEKACPFCGTSVRIAPAPSPAFLGAMAFVVGLSMLGCDKGDDGETGNTMTTAETGGMQTSTGETGTGDGDGDTTGADYGGPTTIDTGDGDGDTTGDGDGDGDGDESGADYGGPTTLDTGDGDGDGDGDTTGDGDGDGDESGADYGGAPPVDPGWKPR